MNRQEFIKYLSSLYFSQKEDPNLQLPEAGQKVVREILSGRFDGLEFTIASPPKYSAEAIVDIYNLAWGINSCMKENVPTCIYLTGERGNGEWLAYFESNTYNTTNPEYEGFMTDMFEAMGYEN